MAIEPLPRDRDTLHPLAGSLERLQRSLGLARPDTLALLTESWPQLVGSRLAAACRLHSLRDGCLTVAVDDPAVAEHLRWHGVEAVRGVDAHGCGVRRDPRGQDALVGHQVGEAHVGGVDGALSERRPAERVAAHRPGRISGDADHVGAR